MVDDIVCQRFGNQGGRHVLTEQICYSGLPLVQIMTQLLLVVLVTLVQKFRNQGSWCRPHGIQFFVGL